MTFLEFLRQEAPALEPHRGVDHGPPPGDLDMRLDGDRMQVRFFHPLPLRNRILAALLIGLYAAGVAAAAYLLHTMLLSVIALSTCLILVLVGVLIRNGVRRLTFQIALTISRAEIIYVASAWGWRRVRTWTGPTSIRCASAMVEYENKPTEFPYFITIGEGPRSATLPWVGDVPARWVARFATDWLGAPSTASVGR
jgi:hypothetical protein